MQRVTTRILYFLAAVLGLSCAMATAFAQATSASLTGAVTDTSGAAIPGAAVTVTNTGTGLAQATVTTGDGVYRVAPLPPGSYALKVMAQGFAPYVQQGIVLTVDMAATQNVTLKLGSTSETVSVIAGAELIDTTTPQLGMTVNETSVTQLPLNGRDPSSLVFLAPGVINASYGNSYLQSGFSFPEETGAAAGGGRQGSTYYLLNGVPNMDTYLGLAAPFPNADATQEFRVITNNFNSMYGFAPGAVVSIATKSGTNDFHGGIFEFLRDKEFNAKNYFSHTVDPLHRNQFGGDVGGPVLKNKLFFFINYQGTRSATASTSNFTQTPTAAMLSGDFSGLSTDGTETLCTSGSSAICPFGVVGGKPNQLLPGYSYNPTAVTIDQTALPVGQQADGGVYYTSSATVNNFDEGTGRLDFDLSPSQRLSLSSYVNNLIQPSGDVPGNILSMLPLSTWQYTFAETMQYFNETLNHTWTINPRTVNVASVFWTQMAAHNGSPALDSNKQPFCWSKYISVTELPGSCFLEGFAVSNGGFNSGWYEPSQEERTTYGLYDNFTRTLGRHTVEAGADIQHQFAEEYTQYPTEPQLTFNGSYTGNGLADFLAGDLFEIFQGAGEVSDIAGWQPGFYGQDEFRLRPNITITAGLRWDPNIPPGIASGRAATFVPGQQSAVYPNAPLGMVFPGDKGVGNGLMRTTYGYWEPRVGVAWQPKKMPRTAFHAGFGMFTQPMIYSAYNHTADNAPFAPTFSYYGTGTTPLPLNNPWAGFAGTSGQSPFPPFASSTYRPPSSVTFTPGLDIPATIAPDFKLGMTESWNVTAEQQISQSMAVRLAYVGSESYHQSVIIDENPGIYANAGARLYSAFSQVLDMVSPATASYNSLQLTVERKLSHGLQFQSNLTWSKAIDVASSSNISFGTNQLGDPFDLAWNRGTSSQNFPWVWVSNFVYTTPRLAGHNMLMQQALGGWEVSGIFTSMTGTPFTVGDSYWNGGNNSGAAQYEDRADVVSGVAVQERRGSRSQWINSYFNTKAFIENAPGTFGNEGKNILTGPPQNFGDAGLDKNWQVRERYNLQFRWEMFNAFNHPLFGVPNNANGWGYNSSGQLVNNNSQEGKITSGGFEAARVMQGALKFTF